MSTLAPDKTFSLAQLLQHRKRSWSTIDEERKHCEKRNRSQQQNRKANSRSTSYPNGVMKKHRRGKSEAAMRLKIALCQENPPAKTRAARRKKTRSSRDMQHQANVRTIKLLFAIYISVQEYVRQLLDAHMMTCR